MAPVPSGEASSMTKIEAWGAYRRISSTRASRLPDSLKVASEIRRRGASWVAGVGPLVIERLLRGVGRRHGARGEAGRPIVNTPGRRAKATGPGWCVDSTPGRDSGSAAGEELGHRQVVGMGRLAARPAAPASAATFALARATAAAFASALASARDFAGEAATGAVGDAATGTTPGGAEVTGGIAVELIDDEADENRDADEPRSSEADFDVARAGRRRRVRGE